MQSVQDASSPSTNYIGQFYLDIENLTTQVSNFNNLLAYLNEKYKSNLSESIEKNDYEAMDNFSQQCRFWANRAYIKFRALVEKIPEFKKEEEKITELYKKVAVNRIIGFDDMLELTIQFNSLFVNGVCDKFFVDTGNAFAKISGGSNGK